MVGFFSTEHQAVFTHHDTFMHLHLMTEDKKQMGHLEELRFKPGQMRLLLPGK
jgi:acetolactate decarboxylase